MCIIAGNIRLFTSFIVLPYQLSQPPYSLNSVLQGVCYLPVGIANILGSIGGGYLSDVSAARLPQAADGRMTYVLPFAWLVPLGCIGYGFTFGYSTNLAGPLLTQSILGFGQSAVLSSSFGFAFYHLLQINIFNALIIL